MTDIRRPEEGLGVGADQHRLAALGRFEPDREPAVAALLHGEDLAPDAIGRIAPGLLLDRLGQGDADLAQARLGGEGAGFVIGHGYLA